MLLLIGEERDHGSKHTRPEQLIEKIGGSDVLVLSVSFSPARAELAHDVKETGGNGDQPTMSLVSTLIMALRHSRRMWPRRLPR